MKLNSSGSRPKKWTMRAVHACTFWKRDHIEQLLIFRKDFRDIRKKSGQKAADHYARSEAIRWVALTSKEVVIGVGIIGKRILIG